MFGSLVGQGDAKPFKFLLGFLVGEVVEWLSRGFQEAGARARVGVLMPGVALIRGGLLPPACGRRRMRRRPHAGGRAGLSWRASGAVGASVLSRTCSPG